MKILNLQFLVILSLFTTSPFNAIPQSNSIIEKQIDSLMSINYLDNKPGASIIVFSDHQLLFKSVYGMANLEGAIANTPETIFRIGSVTKQFTAIGILMMLSEQKLSLSDPISKYYPELFNGKEPITIKNLLTHTSGIKDLSKIIAIRPLMGSGAEPYELINIISQEDLNFKPGEKYEYSNSGYVILGGILEEVSNRTYGEFLKEFIFIPLGMKSTYYSNRLELTDTNYALGYFTRPDNYVEAPDIHNTILFAAGGIWSTVADMATWNEALYSDKLLDPEYIKMAFTPNLLNDRQKTDYGFGFRSCEVNGISSLEHGGGVFGYSSYGIRIEEFGIYVMILSNFERENKYDELAAEIAAIAMCKPYNYVEIDVSEKELKELVGDYLRENGDTVNIKIRNGELSVSKNKKNEQKLTPIAEWTFLIEGSLDDKIIFSTVNKPHLIYKPRRALGIIAFKIE